MGVKSLIEVSVVKSDHYRNPVVAVLYYLIVLALLVAAGIDFVKNQRYARIDTGSASIEARAAPSRAPSIDSTYPDYCTNPLYSWDSSEPFLQAAFGRMCLMNITCQQWFTDNDIFVAGNEEWTVYTMLAGIPYPGTLPNVSQFDIRPMLHPSFAGLPRAQQLAIVSAVFQGNERFGCSPSYYVQQPELLAVRVMHTVSAPRIETQAQVEAYLYDTNGVLVRTFPKGMPVTFRWGEVFKVDYDVLSHIAGSTFSVAPPDPTLNLSITRSVPNITLRATGLKATMNFYYTNIWDDRLNTDIRCHIRPKLVPGTVGMFPTKVIPTTSANGYQLQPFIPAGLRVAITVNSAFGGPHYYETVLYAVSVIVLLGQAGTMAKTLTKGMAKFGLVAVVVPDEDDDEKESSESAQEEDDARNNEPEKSKRKKGASKKSSPPTDRLSRGNAAEDQVSFEGVASPSTGPPSGAWEDADVSPFSQPQRVDSVQRKGGEMQVVETA